MADAKDRWAGLLWIVFLSGCGLPETRYLTCLARPAAVETQSYNLHDPFPDEDAGPNTFTRPRSFMEPRSDSRKNLDLRFLKAAYGFPQQRYAAWDPANPRNIAQYPIQPLGFFDPRRTMGSE